jgi:hypothetical protein
MRITYIALIKSPAINFSHENHLYSLDMNESWQSVDYISAMYKKTFDQSNISDSYVKN